MIEIIFLGTGSAVPTSRRNHLSVFLRYGSENLLFDCGEGTQRQFRKAHLNPCKLTKIFISHWHGDHVLGIPGLLYTLSLNGYNGQLEIYGPKGTREFMKRIMETFTHQIEIPVKVHEVSGGKILETPDFEISAFDLFHGEHCLGYKFSEKDKLRIDKTRLSKLKIPDSPLINELKKGKDIVINKKKIKAKDLTFVQKGKIISLVLDTEFNTKIAELVKDSDLLISESTYLDEKELAEKYRHLTAEDALKIAKSAGVKKVILMHLSQRYERNEKDFLRFARKKFKNVEIAQDLMKVEV